MNLSADHIAWMQADWRRPIKHLLGVEQWHGQRRVVHALQKHHRVAVKSGHKVGKTHLVGSLVCSLLSIYPFARIITSASTARQLKENVWGEIRSQRSSALFPLGGSILPVDCEWTMGPHWYAVGISTNDPDSFQGKHSEQGLVIVILDECQSIDRGIVTAAKSMTSDANGYLLAIANPTIPSGWYYEACTTDPSWHVETLSTLDHPNIVEGRRVMPGPSTGLVDTFIGTSEEGPRLRGEFNEAGGESLISLAAIRACADADLSALENDGAHMGVDLADSGGDKCVAVIQRRRIVDHVEEWTSAGPTGLMQSVGRIQAIAEHHGVAPENVHVDSIGIGSGVVARLHELGWLVDGVNFGAGAVGDWADLHGDLIEFANRRAELYWTAKVLIEAQKACLPAQFREITADLCAPGWSYVSDRKIKIEAKDKIKARLGRSPDHGDAFVLSLSRVGRYLPMIG